jgi:hypothetical protein
VYFIQSARSYGDELSLGSHLIADSTKNLQIGPDQFRQTYRLLFCSLEMKSASFIARWL